MKKPWTNRYSVNNHDYSNIRTTEDDETIYLEPTSSIYASIKPIKERLPQERHNCNIILEQSNQGEKIFRDAIVEGNLKNVNDFVNETCSVAVLLRPLRGKSECEEDDGQLFHPFDLAIQFEQFKILRTLIDHIIRETGVEIFIEILRTTKIQELDVVFMDLIVRYPVAAHALMNSFVSYVKLNGHPVFKEALQLNPQLLSNIKVLKKIAASENNELLRHPLLGVYLSKKWKDFKLIYYLGFIFQIVAALCVTGYALVRKNDDDTGMYSKIWKGFRYVGIILTSIRGFYQICETVRSIIQHQRPLFRPLLLIKEGIFLGFVFAGLLDEGNTAMIYRGRSCTISWVRLFVSISTIPDQRCLYAYAFKRIIVIAFFKAGLGSGIFFPLIGFILGAYIMSEDGTSFSGESLGVLVIFAIFGILVVTYLVGLSVAKVREDVLSIRGEDYIKKIMTLTVYKYQKLIFFWLKILTFLRKYFSSSSSTYIILPKQFEDENAPKKGVFSFCQTTDTPIYNKINENESLDYSNLQLTKYRTLLQTIESIPHQNFPNESGYTNLYWNNR